jgi:CBS domain-containing protein
MNTPVVVVTVLPNQYLIQIDMNNQNLSVPPSKQGDHLSLTKPSWHVMLIFLCCFDILLVSLKSQYPLFGYWIFYYRIYVTNKKLFMQNAVSEVISTKLETIATPENAQKAAKKMKDKHISSVIVIDEQNREEKPVGIITERDLVSRVCTIGRSASDVNVLEVMSSPIAAIEGQATVEAAADLLLSNKVRHLLVVDKQTRKPVGIIAPSDLNRYLEANIDWNEVNARILEAIQSEERSEAVK